MFKKYRWYKLLKESEATQTNSWLNEEVNEGQEIYIYIYIYIYKTLEDNLTMRMDLEEQISGLEDKGEELDYSCDD